MATKKRAGSKGRRTRFGAEFKQQAGLGARYLAEVTAALEHLCEVPYRFPITRPPALRRLGLKRFPFTIFFRELSGAVQSVAIALHRRRSSC